MKTQFHLRIRNPKNWINPLLLIGLLFTGWTLLHSGYDWQSSLSTGQTSARIGFVTALATLPLLGFPVSAFYVFAGLTFPFAIGIPLVSIGLFLNMTSGYWLGRLLLCETVSSFLRNSRYRNSLTNPKQLLRLTFLIRAIPGVPYPLQNYIPGFLRVPFGAYLLISLPIQILFCIGTVFLTRMGKQLAFQGSWIAIVILCASIVAWAWTARRFRTRKASEIDSAGTGSFKTPI